MMTEMYLFLSKPEVGKLRTNSGFQLPFCPFKLSIKFRLAKLFFTFCLKLLIDTMSMQR